MTGRRVLAALVLAALAVLAGCSTGGGATTTAPADTTVTTTTDTTTTTTTASGGGQPTETRGNQSGESGGRTTPETTPVEVDPATVRADTEAAARGVNSYHAFTDLRIASSSNNLDRTVQVERNYSLARERARYLVETTRRAQGQTVRTDQYLVNRTVYTRGPGNVRRFGAEWTELNASGNVTDTLHRQDLLRLVRQDLRNASLSVRGATLDGTPVYVLRADVDTDDYGDVRDLGNRTTVGDVSAVYYVERSSGRLTRYDAAVNWTLSLSNREIDQRIDATFRFAYPDVSITLPDAAAGAVEIGEDSTDNGTATNETSSGSTDGSGTNTTSSGSTDGESAPNGTDSGADTAGDDRAGTDAEGIVVRNGTLAVDPDRQFHRVESAMGTNVTDPAAVVIEEPLNRSDRDDTDDGPATLASVVGLENRPLVGTTIPVGSLSIPGRQVAEVRVGGYGNVYLRSSASMPTAFVRLLATHEFVHYVQFQRGSLAAVNGATDLTTDGRYAARSITEGAAVFTTDAVLAANDSVPITNSDLYAGVESVLPPGSANAYGNSRYVEGTDYVESRIDDPAALESVYESPPTTSEQVLHDLAPGEEPPVPLTVSVRPGEGYVAAASDRKGEAYIRHVLANGVTLERASDAAAGWGNDTVRSLRPTGEGNTSFVWVHRWDDAGEATEFADAARAYLDDYGTTSGGRTLLSGRPARLYTPGERTTVLVIAPASLQDRLSVRADGAEVVVSG